MEGLEPSLPYGNRFHGASTNVVSIAFVKIIKSHDNKFCEESQGSNLPLRRAEATLLSTDVFFTAFAM